MKNIWIVLAAMLAGCAGFSLLSAQEPDLGFQVKVKAGPAAITGSPYSAVAVTENVQTLADGNRIVQNRSEKLYRDGQGRERSETVDGAEAVITDPVGKTGYTLNSETRTARETPAFANFFRWHATSETPNWLETPLYAAKAGQILNELSIQLSPKGGAQAPTAGGRGGVVKVSLAPGAGGRGEPSPTSQNAVKEDLPPQNIEGVYAAGTRTTLTIPAGQIGNEREIKVVDEVWYSPDLQMNVLTKHSDPRMGENTYRLTNISRAEPDPTLFQVPPAYTIVGKKN